MADDEKQAHRAKLILWAVMVGCFALSAALIVKVLFGQRGGSSSNEGSGKNAPAAAARPTDAQVFAQYAKSPSCWSCHKSEFLAWKGSHHGLAERQFDSSIDRIAFDPGHLITHGSQTSEVGWVENKAQVTAPSLAGKLENFSVDRVLGVDPLRQFLLPAPGGRWQSTELAFDPHRREWFDVYGNEDRRPGEWGHWTGRGMTWNSMCAACHNTRLRKNYDFVTDKYQTAMAEMGVGCESCHGPLAEHNRWQIGHPNQKGDPTVRRLNSKQILDTCGSCHARRAELTGEFVPGDDFFDHFSLTIPDETETFYPDGQVREEDYEFTSFLGSRMHAAGVRCIDCHEPHSAKTRAVGNTLCLNCHGAPVAPAPRIDPATHSRHAVGKGGDNCVDCHMPQTTYMQRHGRHDHGFTIPDPSLTKESGVPNACGRCHADKSIDWAIEQKNRLFGQKPPRHEQNRSRIIAAARRRADASTPEILRLIGAETNHLWRASATSFLKNSPADPKIIRVLIEGAGDTSPMVRSAAIRSLEAHAQGGNAEAEKALQARLSDPARAVRIDAAWALRAIVDMNSTAGRDLMTQLRHNADQPAGALQFGVFFMDRGEIPIALDWLQRAVSWDTNSAPLHHELAIGLSKAGRNEEAVQQLLLACRLAPREPEYRFKLGLAFNEVNRPREARQALQEAVQLDPQFARAWYNLGLAQDLAGSSAEALDSLLRAESIDGASALVPYARATILAKLGRTADARTAARRALEIQPDFPQAIELLRRLDQ